MPFLQSTKKRLSYEMFRTVAECYRFAELKNIKVIETNVFLYFAIGNIRKVLSEYFTKEKVEKMYELLKMSIPTHNKGTIDVEDIKLSLNLRGLVRKSYEDPDSVNLLEIMYYAIQTPDEHLIRSIFTQCEITEESIMYALNREAVKRKKPERINEKPMTNPGSPNKSANGAGAKDKDKDEVLKKYCIDYNQKVIDGGFTPIFCRDLEIDQVFVSLMKKTKANPILIGEPGTGKTALIEAVAQRLVSGEAPKRLQDYRILSLSMCSVVQGTTLRGQFEDRLDEILKAIIKDGKIILFIDEIHTVIGSGGDAESGLDASNILKPYLARGEIKCIGATTFDEYYKKMRKDKAFSRRFQRIFVSEPDEKQTKDILIGLSNTLQTYHSCKINEHVIDHIVKLSKRFMTDRFFPDKAIDCLDHACAKSSLHHGIVTKEIVDEVIAEFADIPVSLIRKGDMDRLENVDKIVSSEILGNDKSISEFCNRIKFSYSTKDSRKGVLCSLALYGPSGIGKKSVVEKMANHVYGDNSLIVINGAEYSEQFSINRIIGSPPGYVGHNDETYMMREIRKRPHVVILITNPELMHSTVVECVKNILSTGKLTDVNGMTADFSSSIVVFSIDVECGKSKVMGFVASESVDGIKEKSDSIKKRSSVLNACSYSIYFSDVHEDFKRKITEATIEKVKLDLRNSCIMIYYDDECLDFIVEKTKGSPSEIGKNVRDLLETSICNGFSSKATEYDLHIVDKTLIAKARIHESCVV